MSAANQIHADIQSIPAVPPSSMPTAEITAEKLAMDDKEKNPYATDAVVAGAEELDGGYDDESTRPSEEELLTLRKVAAPMPWVGIAMCAIEFAERASYYGSQGPFRNFVNRPLPPGGNGAGAVAPGPAGENQTAGALGLGSVTASAVSDTFKFLAYVVPIWGAIVADTKWGRFKAIWIGTLIGILAHALLIVPAIPQVIAKPQASLGLFIVSILSLAWAAGFIKPSLGPLLCDQSPVKRPTLKILKTGEKVIVDPSVTVSRWLLIFYWCINVGAFSAIATTYSSRFVGFWLAYLIPGIIYMMVPAVLMYAKKRLYHAPPQGSVVLETMKVLRITLANGGWKRMFKGGADFWERAKPSFIREQQGGELDTQKVFWDDMFVDEIRETISACAVFFLIPIFTLANGGPGALTNSQSAAMTLNGVPNDLIDNFNALSIIVFAPILNFGLYPFMAKIGYPLAPMTRMTIGFLLASASCVMGALVQWRIYSTSPCGWQASTCDDVSPVSLWLQIPIIMLPAIGELFVNVTSYELAYTRSPARMKSLVYALALFNVSIAAAISLGLANSIQDPYLVWVWVALACASFLVAWVFPTYFRHLNVPMSEFANTRRMEGKQQPEVLEQLAKDKEAVKGVYP